MYQMKQLCMDLLKENLTKKKNQYEARRFGEVTEDKPYLGFQSVKTANDKPPIREGVRKNLV